MDRYMRYKKFILTKCKNKLNVITNRNICYLSLSLSCVCVCVCVCVSARTLMVSSVKSPVVKEQGAVAHDL